MVDQAAWEFEEVHVHTYKKSILAQSSSGAIIMLACNYSINQNATQEYKYCSRVAHRVAYTRINCIVTHC